MKRRLVFGTLLSVALVAFLLIDFFEGWSYGLAFLVGLFVLCGLGELFEMARRKGIQVMTSLGIFLAFLLLFVWWRSLEQHSVPGVIQGGPITVELPRMAASSDVPMILAGCLGILMLSLLFRPTGEKELIGVAFTAFGLVYVAFLGGFVLEVRFLRAAADGAGPPHTGAHAVLLMLITTKSADSFAYFSGYRFGKRKLAPRLSPGKTVEGLAGAILGSALVALLYTRVTPLGDYVNWWQACLFGILLAVVAQAGDLAESYIKRSLDTKDSSGLIPAFGGLLDLIDSVLFAAPFTFAYLWLLGLSPG